MFVMFLFFKFNYQDGKLFILNKLKITDMSSNALIVAIHNLILFFCIIPLAWLINQLMHIILFLGSGNLLNNLMFKNSGFNNLPSSFWIVVYITMGLLVIFIIYKFFIIMISSYNKQVTILSTLIKNLILIIIFLPFIPLFFYLINQVLAIILYTIIGKGHLLDLAQLIFNSSFTDKMNNLTAIPSSTADSIFTDQEHFSYFLCIIVYLIVIYILFIVGNKLVIFLVEIFWLFITTFLVFISIIAETENSYKYLKSHNLMLIQKLAIYSGIFLAFNIFSNSISIIVQTIQDSNINISFSKSLLSLIVISAYAFFILEVPILVFQLIGINNSINPFRHGKLFFLRMKGIYKNGHKVFKYTTFNKKNSIKSNNNLDKIHENKKMLLNSDISKNKKNFRNNIKFKNNNLKQKWKDRWDG